jgi:hypothetical protein
MENEAVIRKIQKLLELAVNPNEAEASLAMARAQELLAKYNLDFAMVTETAVKGGTVAPAPEKREKTKISRSAQYRWQRELWKIIAEANFCHHWIAHVYEGKRGVGKVSKVAVKRHMVLGKESNVIVVRMMGEYLEDTMERLLPYPNNERMSRSALSWKAGCAERLGERIRENMDRMKQAGDAVHAAGTALVLRDVFLREEEANHDARWGIGSWAQLQIEDAQWEAGCAERERKATEERIKKEKEWLVYLQNETPEQKRERENVEEKERIKNERYWHRRRRSWAREEARESSKVDAEAYESGRSKGDEINLSTQISDRAPIDKSRRLD